jgi:HD domain/GAF domain
MEPTTQKLIHAFAALADLGQEVAGTSELGEMVLTSLHLLLGTLAIRKGAVADFEPGTGALKVVGTRGMREDFPSSFELSGRDQASLCLITSRVVKLPESEPSLVFPSVHRELLERCGINLIAPMVVRGELEGVIFLGEKATGEPFTDEECATLASMVRHIGVGLHTHRLLGQVAQRAAENRRLYDDLRRIYQDTVRAFAKAIDIKDKYTQGHSERVGKYSEIIARELGWSDEEVEGIAVAGYLHDIGKLVVERDVINAPYPIDAKASAELNRHPMAGYEILLPIHHPYADIPLITRYHHERIDGRGYPEGLSGDQIPLGARIVTLADSFDAMTTDRPYRRRRSLSAVLDDFRQNAGKQFDMAIVVAFCRAMLKEIEAGGHGRGMIRMLGRDYFAEGTAAELLKNLIAELDAPELAAAAGNP